MSTSIISKLVIFGLFLIFPWNVITTHTSSDQSTAFQGPYTEEGHRFTLPPPTTTHQAASVALLDEDFEGQWPSAGWDMSDNTGGVLTWGQRECHPHSGNFAAWNIGGGTSGSYINCDSYYVDNLYNWVRYGPIDLSHAQTAFFTFYLYGSSQMDMFYQCGDILFAGSSTDGSNFTGPFYCSNWTKGDDGNGYYKRTIDLTPLVGSSTVYIAFVFQSDGYYTYNPGFTIDDIKIEVTQPQSVQFGDHPTFLPLVSRGLTLSGSSVERLQNTLSGKRSGDIFVLDKPTCTFSKLDGYYYVSGAYVKMTNEQAAEFAASKLSSMIFRAYSKGLLNDYSYFDPMPVHVEYPQTNQAYLSFSQEPEISFVGLLEGEKMDLTYLQDYAASNFGYGSAFHIYAEGSCGVKWLPRDEWPPMRVSNVHLRDLPIFCLDVTWEPAPSDIPGAPVAYYQLHASTKDEWFLSATAPGYTSIFTDCNPSIANGGYYGTIYYGVQPVSDSGVVGVMELSDDTILRMP